MRYKASREPEPVISSSDIEQRTDKARMSVGNDDVRMIEDPFRSNTSMPMPPDEKRNEVEPIKCVQVLVLHVSFHHDMGLIGQLRTLE